MLTWPQQSQREGERWRKKNGGRLEEERKRMAAGRPEDKKRKEPFLIHLILIWM